MSEILKTPDGTILRVGELIASGAQGSVHAVSDRPNEVIKRLHEPDKIEWRQIDSMAGQCPKGYEDRLAWPLSTVLNEEGKPVGILMRKLDAQPLLTLYQPRDLRDRASRATRRRAARETAELFSVLNNRHIIFGDVSEDNLVVIGPRRRKVGAVDCTSMQMPDIATGGNFRCPVGRGEYTAPELLQEGVPFAEIDRNVYHDAFSLCVIIYRLLSGNGAHPFECQYTGTGTKPSLPERIRDGICPAITGPVGDFEPPSDNRFDQFPAVLQDLFRTCFVDGHDDPTKRPLPDAWMSALRRVRASQLPRSSHERPKLLAMLTVRVNEWMGLANEGLGCLADKARKACAGFEWRKKMNGKGYKILGIASLTAAVVGIPALIILSRSPAPPEAPRPQESVSSPVNESVPQAVIPRATSVPRRDYPMPDAQMPVAESQYGGRPMPELMQALMADEAQRPTLE